MTAAHMTLLEMLKREQPMAAIYSWLRNDCGMPATATIIKSVPDIIAALEAAENVAVAAEDLFDRGFGSIALCKALNRYRRIVGYG